MPSFRRNGKSVLQFITNETKESWERLSDSQVFMEFTNMDVTQNYDIYTNVPKNNIPFSILLVDMVF